MIAVEAIDTGRVLNVVPFFGDVTEVDTTNSVAPMQFTLGLQLSSLSVSLILERPKRREFLALHAEKVEKS